VTEYTQKRQAEHTNVWESHCVHYQLYVVSYMVWYLFLSLTQSISTEQLCLRFGVDSKHTHISTKSFIHSKKKYRHKAVVTLLDKVTLNVLEANK